MSDCGQYYAVAITTIFSYDFFLTLAGEVSRLIAIPLVGFIDPPVKDQIRLEREEIMGYIGIIACRTAFVDDVAMFAIFIVVRSLLQRSSSFLRR